MTKDELICPECGSSDCIEISGVGECDECDNTWDIEPKEEILRKPKLCFKCWNPIPENDGFISNYFRPYKMICGDCFDLEKIAITEVDEINELKGVIHDALLNISDASGKLIKLGVDKVPVIIWKGF